MKSTRPLDKTLLFLVLALTLGGYFIFLSASSGLLARDGGASFSSVAIGQTLRGLLPGLLALTVFSFINYKIWRKYSFYIFLFSVFTSLLVFLPMLGFEHGGAKRWIGFSSFTFQPTEFLKLGAVIYTAALLTSFREKISSAKYGLLAIIVLGGVVGAILFAQPDFDTLVVILSGMLAVYFVAGGNLKHITLLILIGIIAVVSAAFSKDYIKDRIFVFMNSEADNLGSGYHIRQSLIAVGSGGFWGKGFGQSVQKFGYLPEPIGDSVFAVFSEEFGFVGSFALVLVMILFTLRSFYISSKIPDAFGRALGAGIITMIMIQAFINIGAMIKIFPVSGITLPFVSHGGSALVFTLIGAGILLNLSRH